MSNPVIRFIDVSNPTTARIEIDPTDVVWIEGRSKPVMVGDYVHRSEFSAHGTPLQRLAQVVEDAMRRGYNSTAPRLLCSFLDRRQSVLANAIVLQGETVHKPYRFKEEAIRIQVSSDRETEVEIRFSGSPEFQRVVTLHRGDNVIALFEKGQGPRPQGEGFFTIRPVGEDHATRVENAARIDWKNPGASGLPSRPRGSTH